MESVKSKIRFYNMGSEKVSISKLIKEEFFDYSKSVFGNNYNVALKNVIEKDLKKLQVKINEVINQIKAILISKGITYDIEDTNIDNIDFIIKSIDDKISFLIIESNHNKVGIFTINKKNKRMMKEEITETLDFLTKSQSDIISIKNEYNKLLERKKLIAPSKEDFLNEKLEKEDPLERTINFYMNQSEL